MEKGDLTLPADTTVERVQSLLNRLGRVDWNVKILDRYEHGRGVVELLGPLSQRRSHQQCTDFGLP